MNRLSAGISQHSVPASSSFSAGPLSSTDHGESSSLAQKIISEHPGGASCSKPLGHRARRAQQNSSNPIETSEWPKEALQMLGEKALRDVQEFERLWGYLMRSKTDSKCVQAAKNAIEALNLIGFSFSGKDLSGVNIPGTNLSYGLFQRTNFSGANLEGVNFQGAHLENASFVGSNLKNIDFGQFHLRDFASSGRGYCLAVHRDEVHNQTIVAIGDHYKPDPPKFDQGKTDFWDWYTLNALGYKYKPDLYHGAKIHLWSLENRRRLFTWDCEGSVINIAFTSDGERLISGTGEGLIKIWNVETGALINTFKANYLRLEDYRKDTSIEGLIPLGAKPVAGYSGYFEVSLEELERYFESHKGEEDYNEKTLKRCLDEHRKKISIFGFSVSLNPSAPLIACANRNGNIYVWDLNENRLVNFIDGEEGTKNQVIDKPYFTSNINHLVTITRKGIRLFDMSTDRYIRKWSFPFDEYLIRISSPDGRLFASLNLQQIDIWSYKDEQPIKFLGRKLLTSFPRLVAFANHSELLAVAFSYDIQVWNWNRSEWALVYHWAGLKNFVTALLFADQDRSLISLSRGEEPRVWKLSHPIETKSVTHPFAIQSMKISPDGKKLFSLCHQTLKVWNALSGFCLHTLEGGYRRFTLPRDGRYLLLQFEKKITLWDFETKAEIMAYDSLKDIKGVGFLKSGRLLIIGDEKFLTYDLEKGQFRQVLKGAVKNVAHYALSDDGRWVGMCSREGHLIAWDSESRKLYSIKGVHHSKITSFRFSGSTIISISSFFHLWNLQEGWAYRLDKFNSAWTIPGYPHHILLKKKNSSLYIYSKEGSSIFRFVDKIPRKIQSLVHKSEGEIDPDIGTSIDVTTEGGAWSIEDKAVYSPEWDNPFFSSTLAVHPTSPLIAIGGYNGMIRFWNLITKRLLNVLWGHTDTITQLSFSDDGLSLFSTGYDRTILCWDLTSGVTTATLRWRSGRSDLNLHGVNTHGAHMDHEVISFLTEQQFMLDVAISSDQREMLAAKKDFVDDIGLQEDSAAQGIISRFFSNALHDFAQASDSIRSRF